MPTQTFTSTAQSPWTVPAGVSTVQVLVVGGGGGGGSVYGGGGGGGGVVYNSSFSVSGSVTFTIGAGGTGGTSQGAGSAGTNSTFGSITANGGGGGGGYASVNGASGGSGGGGAGHVTTAGTGGTGSQGSGGGAGNTAGPGGGGGGYSAAGASGTATVAGAGGNGYLYSANSTYYGGGGGAGTDNAINPNGGAGGLGGGGAGKGSTIGIAGTANTGGGGGGGGYVAPTSYAGGNGGSGVIIVTWVSPPVTGPSSSITNDVATFADTTGTVIKDSGVMLGTAASVSATMGGDLSGTLPNPTVSAIHETGGPTQLVIGSIPNGSFLTRSGGTLVGATPSGAGNVTGPGSSTNGHLALFNGTTGTIIEDGGPLYFVAVANTLALMRALSPSSWPDGSIIALLGYNSRDDGGGGMFEWNASATTADDSGTIIQITGVSTGRLFRIDAQTWNGAYRQSTTLDIRWFGGCPGNALDCAPAVSKAAASLAAGVTYKNGTIYFPAGYYAFFSPIVLPGGGGTNGISLKGDGPQTVFSTQLQAPNFLTVTNYTAGQLVTDTTTNQIYRCILSYTSTSTVPSADPTNWTLNLAFLEISLGQGISLDGFTIEWSAGVNAPSCIYFHDAPSGTIRNIQVQGFTATGMLGNSAFLSGALLNIFNATGPIVSDCVIAGGGQALMINSSSAQISNCEFSTTSDNPCYNNVSCDALSISNCYFAGGGPWAKYAGCAITRTTGNFTITTPNVSGGSFIIGNTYVITATGGTSFVSVGASSNTVGVVFTATGIGTGITGTAGLVHTFTAGDYILVSGATQATYNNWWKIASVPAPNQWTVTFANSLTSDSCTLTSLRCCWYVQYSTESQFDSIYLSTGGITGVGSVALFLDGYTLANNPPWVSNQTFASQSSCVYLGVPYYKYSAGSVTSTTPPVSDTANWEVYPTPAGNNNGAVSFSNVFCDYGYCKCFLHGIATLPSGIPQSSVHQVSLVNFRANGGPADQFGGIRIEGCVTVQVTAPFFFPGAPGGASAQNPTVCTYVIVISDGGQSNKTQDIVIEGGSLTNKNASGLSATTPVTNVVFDGANVHNVSVVNPGVDAAQTIAALTNSGTGVAALANGLTVMFGNNAGRVNLIDSSRGIGGGSI